MQVKNFNQEQIQDWYISVFLYSLKSHPVIGCARNTDWWNANYFWDLKKLPV